MSNTEETRYVIVDGKKMTEAQALALYLDHRRKTSTYQKPSVKKILVLLGKSKFPLTRSEIARDVGVSRVYARRLLEDLKATGAVSKIDPGSGPIIYVLTESGMKMRNEIVHEEDKEA